MGIDKSIDSLQPELAKRTRLFLEQLKKQNIEVAIVETNRSKDVQIAYYSQGRNDLATTNKLREKAGLWLISESENSRKVTNTLDSRHIDGNAVDVCPVLLSKYWWDAPQHVWESIGKIGEQCGLDWCAGGYGQTWGKGWDNPHFELMV